MVAPQEKTAAVAHLRQKYGASSIADLFCMYYGPEFVSVAVRQWCERKQVRLDYIQPGRPMQNGHIESFNGKFRDECLNTNWFTTLRQARSIIEHGGGITTKCGRTAH